MTIQWDVPNPITDFIREQTLAGGFSSEGEYLLTLVERDRIRVAKEELESKILQGLSSELDRSSAREFLRQKREEVRRRIELGEFSEARGD